MGFLSVNASIRVGHLTDTQSITWSICTLNMSVLVIRHTLESFRLFSGADLIIFFRFNVVLGAPQLVFFDLTFVSVDWEILH